MPTEMDREAFMARFGAVFEHSPWIAEAVYERAAGSPASDAAGLLEQFRSVILAAGPERQLGLLRAHPELAVAEAEREALTEHSRSEQASAGLDRCTSEEFAAFRSLNERYRAKFGFPFIVAVRGRGKAEILRLFERRLRNPPDVEFDAALEQVVRIGGLRIGAIVHD